MQYGIGDAKSGTLVGKDQYVHYYSALYFVSLMFLVRFGNKYFENLNAEEEIPGRFQV